MPSVNKQSLREEFDKITTRFEALSNEGKVTAESSALFQAMIMLFELLIAVFMEKKTRKNNRNSSIPSSQTGKDRTAATSGTNSKGKIQNGLLSSNTRTVETTQVAKVKDCRFCGEGLDDIFPAEYERRTKIDVIFEKVVSHVDAEIKVCPRCNMQNKGLFPEDMSGPLQYGPGIKGYVVNLLVAQMISLKRVQQMVQTLIG
jgi:hypothetical protein